MPAIIRGLLNRLRGRERLLGLAWAAARAVAVVALLFIAACMLDWTLDRWGDTPFAARVALLAVQVVVWALALVFIALPLVRRWTDDRLALWIEEKVPALGHRLISAVQLNRAGAKTAGMSPALIEATTRQAEEQAARVDLREVCDGARLKWAALLLGPVAAVALALFALAPVTAAALAARQFLADVEVPRRVQLASTNRPVWAVGEEGTLRFEVSGLHDGEEPTGTVRIIPDGGSAFAVPLVRESGNVFAAKVPPGEAAFAYRAWLVDGRLRDPGEVRYAPRPVVQSLRAWVQLPLSLARKADGNAYEEEQRGGDIVYRIDGTRARLEVISQVPIRSGTVYHKGDVLARLKVQENGQTAEATFDLTAPAAEYSVALISEDDLESTDVPRRSIRRVPLELPEVALLPETFYKQGDRGTAEDWEVEGIPVLEGERFKLTYRSGHRYGLSHAQLRYRVIPLAKDEGSGDVDAGDFRPLPLGPGRNPPKVISPEARREFALLPAAGPDALPDTEAAGEYNFEISGIPDGKGGRLRLKKGDRIQFYVEVYSKADPDGKPGRSAIREKEVVDEKGYFTWLERKDDLKERTRALEESARTTRPGGGG